MANTRKKVEGTPQVVTANRLLEGDVVYLTASGGWTTEIGGAVVIEGTEAEAHCLAEAERAVAERQVVGPYLMQVEFDPEGPLPVSQRERIRARRGPTAGSTVGSSLGQTAVGS